MINSNSSDKNMEGKSRANQYILIIAMQVAVAVVVVGAYAFYTQSRAPMTEIGKQVTPVTTSTSDGVNPAGVYIPAGFAQQLTDQRSASLAVLDQISGNDLVIRVPVVNQSAVSKISTSDFSKPISLSTSVKTFDLVIDSSTQFVGLSQKDLVIGKGYAITVDKPFFGATGKLTALSITLSNLSVDKLSTPLLIAPPVFSR
jgi:hypothetical protein